MLGLEWWVNRLEVRARKLHHSYLRRHANINAHLVNMATNPLSKVAKLFGIYDAPSTNEHFRPFEPMSSLPRNGSAESFASFTGLITLPNRDVTKSWKFRPKLRNTRNSIASRIMSRSTKNGDKDHRGSMFSVSNFTDRKKDSMSSRRESDPQLDNDTNYAFRNSKNIRKSIVDREADERFSFFFYPLFSLYRPPPFSLSNNIYFFLT